jgi:hypothetical protein
MYDFLGRWLLWTLVICVLGDFRVGREFNGVRDFHVVRNFRVERDFRVQDYRMLLRNISFGP